MLKKITLVMDNLNTHTPGSFYEAFQPAQAKQLWDRFDFVFTPKHESWLNVAEIELNVLTGQCLNRRIDSIEDVRRETTAWQEYRNKHKSNVNWQFTADDVRIKLARLYPLIDTWHDTKALEAYVETEMASIGSFERSSMIR